MAGQPRSRGGLAGQLDEIFRDHWWAAVAIVTRLVGDLEQAEDAVQDACAAALAAWPAGGIPASPRAWLVSVARHKALDRIRRESRRAAREAAATAPPGPLSAAGQACPAAGPAPENGGLPDAAAALWAADDQLGLVFMCCHPALDPAARISLTLRCVCGLSTAEIAAAFLVPEPTMAQRLVRAKRKIRQAGVPLQVPSQADLPARLDAVLRVVYLVFTAGHSAARGGQLVRGSLCEEAIRLARVLAGLVPDQPEARGLLALLLLTDARRAARVGRGGELVLLEDQDRSRWDAAKIAEGCSLVRQALGAGRPGAYQLHAAIAACHSGAASAAETDWRQIVGLYNELFRYEPTPVIAANRAAAVAMAEGPRAGLDLLERIGADPALARWPQLHIATAELRRRAGQREEALAAYRRAGRLGLPDAQRAFVDRRIGELEAHPPTDRRLPEPG